jgi:hypothetical protein
MVPLLEPLLVIASSRPPLVAPPMPNSTRPPPIRTASVT